LNLYEIILALVAGIPAGATIALMTRVLNPRDIKYNFRVTMPPGLVFVFSNVIVLLIHTMPQAPVFILSAIGMAITGIELHRRFPIPQRDWQL